MTDTVSDYLTRVRNAISANHRIVEIPASNLKKEITKILYEKGYILNYKFEENEKKQGTIELLLTKPLTIWQIVGGKFFGAMLLIVIALLPTFLYVYIVSDLAFPSGNIDMGSIIGSYFGLLFLISSYTAIGIYTSTLSENQIVAFIIAVFLCFLFYFGFEGISSIFSENAQLISFFGMDYHFKSISRGVIDTRDVIYFLSFTFLFLSLTVFNLKSLKS